MPSLRRHGDAGSSSHRRLAFAVAAAVVAADQIAKQLATRLLPQDGPVHVFGGVHLQLFRNFAGPGGHWAGHTVAISVFTVVAAIVLAAVIARSRLDRLTAIALGLFLGGAIGNGLDRLFRGPGPLRGGVVDWLAPSAHGASMNLADLSLNAAVVVLLAGALLSLLPTKKRRRRVDPDATA
ncbi:MAG TPA: signal peptidase II [Solirubrobacterales bacterium]|nr:signal peptidase II [Solirubrobacterales bacterium]